MLDESIKPVPKKDVDYTSLPVNPTPSEYFLLSRIDGRATVKDLCSVSGMGQDETLAALENLRLAGLIDVPGAQKATPSVPSFGAEAVGVDALSSEQAQAPQPPQKTKASAPQVTSIASVVAPAEDVYALFPSSLAAFDGIDQAILDDPEIELEPERRRLIMYVYANLDHVDHYQLFGLKPDAPRKAVRKAFNRLAKQFHPDLFYGRAMGALSEQAEAVFLRVNLAQQILSHKKKRAEYDRAQERASERLEEPSMAEISEALSQASQSAEARQDKKREMAVMVLLRRAERYEQAEEWVKAAAEYRKAFGLKRDAGVALRSAGLLIRAGHEHLDQAVLMAKAAYKVDSTNIAALMLIGDAYEEGGRLDDAARYYKLILRQHPEHATATKRLRYLDAQR